MTQSTPSESAAIVIPAHNHAAYVLEAVESALRQSRPASEIIVVDDGSTDETAGRVRSISDARLTLIQQKNSGPSAARNAGWRRAKSDWVFFLDADDRMPAGALSALISAARKAPNCIPYGIEAVHPETMAGEPAFTAAMSTRDGNLLEDIAVNYHGTIFTGLFPRRVLEVSGGFDEKVWFGEDFDFAVKLALSNNFCHVPEITYEARMHRTNRHRSFDAKARQQYLGILRARLGGESSAPLRRLHRKALAHWHWRFGTDELRRGNKKDAARCFLMSLRHAPWKLGAWRGMLQSLSRASAPS